jgi:hypothetical protein
MVAIPDDYRRIGLILVTGLVLLSVVLGVTLLTRPKTPFEWEQAHAEALNPRWVLVEITTADNRREYRESEPIFVTPHFSSAKPYMYKIEVMEGWGPAAVEFLHISNWQQSPRMYGFICCDSRLIGLDEKPYSPRTIPPLRLPPGRYEVYVTSRRVFTWDKGPKEYVPSTFQVASNMLKIRVVPDAGKVPGSQR